MLRPCRMKSRMTLRADRGEAWRGPLSDSLSSDPLLELSSSIMLVVKESAVSSVGSGSGSTCPARVCNHARARVSS